MEETDFVNVEGVVVPESALRRDERENKYGSVPGLDDEELADPDELERQVFLEAFAPVLMLPRSRRSDFRPDIDEHFGVDWGAFGTVDFDRFRPSFDKVRYKAHKLRDELKNVLIMIDVVKRRLPTAKYLVLKYLRLGIIGLEHVANWDMYQLAELWQRARRLQSEIASCDEVSRGRQEKELTAVLG